MLGLAFAFILIAVALLAWVVFPLSVVQIKCYCSVVFVFLLFPGSTQL